MKSCLQTKNQSDYQHGISVKEHFDSLLNMMRSGIPELGWRLPDWLMEYRQQILSSLLPLPIIEEYLVYHDCSKPYCLIIDDNGKGHFPNHSNLSYEIWLKCGGNIESAQLMKMDMDIHKMKAVDIDEFIKRKEAITLLIAGLAEIHSNCNLFGGIESVSFKIKFKQINKCGKNICQKLFKEQDAVAT